MDVMYIKYNNGQRYSIIKEGENIIMNNSKIIPFNSAKNIKNGYNTNSNNINTKDTYDYNIDEKITNFFFEAIHKNHLLNKNK